MRDTASDRTPSRTDTQNSTLPCPSITGYTGKVNPASATVCVCVRERERLNQKKLDSKSTESCQNCVEIVSKTDEIASSDQ